MKRTVRIFIASSSENLIVVKSLCSVLRRARKRTFRIDPAPWDQDTFKLSDTNIESLEKEMDRADFAVLVLTPNDVTRIRDEEVLTPRDNVLFELGLFMGRLHRERCYMLYERDDKPKLPTDLLGVGSVTYQKTDRSGLEKALAPASQKILERVSEILEGQKLSSFVAQIEGEWWERAKTKAGIELSFFNIFPKDKYKSLHMVGEAFSRKGVPIGNWKSVAVGILETQRKLFYHWEGENPPTPEGNASRVQGFGTFEFNHAKGRLEKGKGGFADVNPNAMSTAQWKTVRIKRVTIKKDIKKMTNGSLAAKEALVRKVINDW